MDGIQLGNAVLDFGDSLDAYRRWEPPVCIISDGPYGLGKYPGEPNSVKALPELYEPHIAAWAMYSRPDTTLWFWNSEHGWATVHPVLESHGWVYEETVVWDKGISHVAGRCNSTTIRGVPVVTELAVRYTREPIMPGTDAVRHHVKDWLRAEWQRSGLPMAQANEACGVRSAATRKWLTADHCWYFPPLEAVAAMADWCNRFGQPTDRPYFSKEDTGSLSSADRESMRRDVIAQLRSVMPPRAKWHHIHGLSNVWTVPAVRGAERFKAGGCAVSHANQKPLSLMARQIELSTDPGDIVWEPFGGLCSASVAAVRAGRKAYACEMNSDYYAIAAKRLQAEIGGAVRMAA